VPEGLAAVVAYEISIAPERGRRHGEMIAISGSLINPSLTLVAVS
jgi:hypothetical protein